MSLSGGAAAFGGFTIGSVATESDGRFLHFDRSLKQ